VNTCRQRELDRLSEQQRAAVARLISRGWRYVYTFRRCAVLVIRDAYGKPSGSKVRVTPAGRILNGMG
jgi:sRNA-binding protein